MTLKLTERSQNSEDAKVVLGNAVQHVDQSVKIWLAAADLENDTQAKKRVLRKGEHRPSRFWLDLTRFSHSSRTHP